MRKSGAEQAARDTGIDIVGNAPWGTHFCQFYETRQDLVDILVPYFIAGLRNNEFCMWVTSPPLDEHEAEQALREALPDLDRYLEKGQIEIISYTEWYLKDGGFESGRVLDGWIGKLERARAKGYDGLRLTGNTFWLEKAAWADFAQYEQEVNDVIGKHRMMAACTYSLEKCGASEIVEVIGTHQFALIKRRGRWEICESAEQRRLVDELQDSRERFSALYTSMVEGVAFHEVVYDESGEAVDYIIIDANPAYERITGLSKPRIVGKKASAVYGAGEAPYLDVFARVTSSGQPESFETYLPRTGKHLLVSLFSTGKGEFTTVLEDITERRRSEEALRLREADLRHAQALGRIGSWRMDVQRDVLEWSDESYRMFGVPLGTPLTYEDFLAAVHPEDRESVDRAWQAALRGEPYSIEHRILVDGEVKWIHERADLEFDAKGILRGGFGTCQDVTQHRQAEQALERALEAARQREAEVEALLLASRAILNYHEFPNAARAIFGACKQAIGAVAGYVSLLTPDRTQNDAVFLDAGGLPCTVDPSLPMPLRGLRAKSYRQRRALYDNDFANSQWVGFLPEGHVELENALFAPLLLEGSVVGLLGLANKPGGFTDDDLRMAGAFGELAAIALRNSWMLEALEKSEEQYRTLAENAQDVIYRYRLGEEPEYEYVSPAITALTGYTPEEFYSDPEIDLKIYHPDDQVVLAAARRFSADFSGPVMARWLRKDGTTLWMELRRTPIYDSHGDVVAIEGVARDITERIRSLEELDQLRSEFLGIVTHELRTPLAAIKGSAATGLGSQKPLNFEETQELLQIIDEQADRLRDLTDNLLDMTRIEAGSLTVLPEPMNLAAAIEDAQRIFLRSGRSQALKLELADGLPLVKADRRRVVQVLANLLGNAARFSPPSSEITVQVEHDAAQVTVRIRDRGQGIPEDRLPDLFKKFSQVHDTGKARVSGTGLGLAICKGIVEAHGGRIWAESAGEGEGSTFSFTLPVAAEERSATGQEVGSGPTIRRGKRIRVLAVDDELPILHHLQHSLEQAGYKSIVTGDPTQVLRLVETEEPHLVLLDLRLPRTSGFELLQRIREFSDVPVIFLTASDRDEDTVSALKMGADDYITKPFSPSELLARIEAALRRRARPEMAKARPPFVVNGLEINFVERRVTLDGRTVHLSATEYKVLHELATHAGRILTHDQILQRVWGAEYQGERELVRSMIRSLRHKLGDDARNPRYIFAERQVGYGMAKG